MIDELNRQHNSDIGDESDPQEHEAIIEDIKFSVGGESRG
jgi:hypothetical protein